MEALGGWKASWAGSALSLSLDLGPSALWVTQRDLACPSLVLSSLPSALAASEAQTRKTLSPFRRVSLGSEGTA